ncbi:MAG: helix-turn-helix domain-containing protein [Siculibacillus sp.]|nr:helix-turn-helix domain-containing protein [Siculibacillus sp.]
MDVGVEAGVFSEAHHLSLVREAELVLDRFERALRRVGATHILLTGLPLPRRLVSRLILRIVWPDLRNGGHVIDVANGDPLLGACLAARRPFSLRNGRLSPKGVNGGGSDGVVASELVASAGGASAELIAVPIHDLRPYQGCVLIAGSDLPSGASFMAGLEHLCLTAFRRLIEGGRLDSTRPGGLSERERHVLQLTAIGKTAAEIADLLAISQRTVHAHLQNASDKMNASNKTHTVVEALRYGQIEL